ncbi:NAD(P)-dependent oxidoreductase [Glycomyces sp. TRM65418]|uniref:NAD(P)-dependent oxidoreductase n=1 Tax=Glycomyces sp. TRM65418 TaxID=2867006 RepID=UPI001CE4ED83|nr:NAD(P)-dependent oxidoreductase [Glycomyces sp. TRM65418]MCC3765160.1 NAD(P)-dependent oxidoreductase [Glycomyces sp. TRM65418]QZD54786.1 NAD(P)-dependent oxidoreductase [Glycomyces sp. TRM65418]
MRTSDQVGPVGFLGLGIMGQPMALNLVRAEFDVVVWNRTRFRCDPLAAAGATVAESSAEVFAACPIVVLMLADESAVDAVLDRDGGNLESLVEDRTVVQMGTFAPDYSRRLAAEVHAAGGRYVEAPVSGSRGPAEAGTLVAMLAGEPDAVAAALPVVAAMCGEHFACGEVPSALMTKLAANIFLITMVTGLAETFHFARAGGVDPHVLRAVLDAGPMSSPVSRGKVAKLVEGDREAQAAVGDVLKNNVLIDEAARADGTAVPLLRLCRDLYQQAVDLGLSGEDMIAVADAIAARDRT